ncbi:unnamed protein product [Bemisia tabaci]|uniref:Uncharacterized protein n=1 Tax=Bemisia tabaci TaxID=7038 RepID=A0A9P0A9Q7_BEMTA|nr:unnamed protein product [Bemisia tabaci]
MFIKALKPSFLCVLAVLAVQALTAHAKPPPPTADSDEESDLATRGLLDIVTNPVKTISDGVSAVDNGLRTARSAGRDAVFGSVGKGLELATGVNPSTILELPKTMAKTAIRGTRHGTEITADATDETLNGVLDMHDRNKQLLNNFVLPVAPTVVSNAINGVNDRFESTVETVKGHVQDGKNHVVNRLNDMEDWVERGGSVVPDAVKGGIQGAGDAGKAVTGTGGGWLTSWIPGWSSSAPQEQGIAPAAATAGAGRTRRNSRNGGTGQAGESGQNGLNGQLTQAAGARTGLSRFLPW